MKQKVSILFIALFLALATLVPSKAYAAPSYGYSSWTIKVNRSCPTGVKLSVSGSGNISIKPYFWNASSTTTSYNFGGGQSRTFPYSSSAYQFSVSGNIWSASAGCR